MTNATVTVDRADLQAAIREEYIEGRTSGRHWHYVTVWPDSTITHGAEADPCFGEREYYRKGNPWPVTVWAQTFCTQAGPADGEFDWQECPEDEATFWTNEEMDDWADEPDDDFVIPCRLVPHLLDDLDWDIILPDVETRLAEAGYALSD
jgi:hypothetical protein